MTIYINRQDAENNFPKLLSKVLEGEEIIILIDEEKIAKILPYKNQKEKEERRITEPVFEVRLGDEFKFIDLDSEE